MALCKMVCPNGHDDDMSFFNGDHFLKEKRGYGEALPKIKGTAPQLEKARFAPSPDGGRAEFECLVCKVHFLVEIDGHGNII